MNNHELLDMIGEVNEDYVLVAGDNAARPRFRWKTLAACAACAALIVAAYPAWQAFQPRQPAPVPGPEETQGPLIERPGLHPYTLVEQSVQIMTTQGDAPAAFGGNQEGGASIDAPGQEVPLQDAASEQYSQLLLWLFGTTLVDSDEQYPEWFGGAWIDNSYFPEARLAVAIVDSFHTPGLEAQIQKRCGGTVEMLFPSVKYSRNELIGLMDQIGQIFEALDCRSYLSYGLNEMGNRIDLSFREEPSDEVLAALAQLDPDGDAIFIQVFTGARIVLTDGTAEAPAPVESAADSVGPGARSTPEEDG